MFTECGTKVDLDIIVAEYLHLENTYHFSFSTQLLPPNTRSCVVCVMMSYFKLGAVNCKHHMHSSFMHYVHLLMHSKMSKSRTLPNIIYDTKATQSAPDQNWRSQRA